MLTMENITWANGFIILVMGLMGWTAKSLLATNKVLAASQQWQKDREAICASHEKRIERTEDRLMQ